MVEIAVRAYYAHFGLYVPRPSSPDQRPHIRGYYIVINISQTFEFVLSARFGSVRSAHFQSCQYVDLTFSVPFSRLTGTFLYVHILYMALLK